MMYVFEGMGALEKELRLAEVEKVRCPPVKEYVLTINDAGAGRLHKQDRINKYIEDRKKELMDRLARDEKYRTTCGVTYKVGVPFDPENSVDDSGNPINLSKAEVAKFETFCELGVIKKVDGRTKKAKDIKSAAKQVTE